MYGRFNKAIATLHTKAGEVNLKAPRLRHLPFETAIIERYKRRESLIEEALIEMYLAGVSVRRILKDSVKYLAQRKEAKKIKKVGPCQRQWECPASSNSVLEDVPHP